MAAQPSPPPLTRCPLTQRMICSLCWNQQHDSCHDLYCNCLHWEATDARSRDWDVEAEDDEDDEDEDEDV
jgi:hypothetical protein